MVGIALVAWSAVMWLAERVATQERSEKQLTLRDAVVIGVVQICSLVPGVSRSGATISAGLFLGLDRVAATRLSFFLSIPALTAAGVYELRDALDGSIGVGPMVVGTVVAFVVAFASVAWLLRFVAHHTIAWFVPYRVVLGVAILVLLGAGVMPRLDPRVGFAAWRTTRDSGSQRDPPGSSRRAPTRSSPASARARGSTPPTRAPWWRSASSRASTHCSRRCQDW